MKTVTVSASSRPLYTSLVLSALARCRGVGGLKVIVNVDAPEGSEQQRQVCRVVEPFLKQERWWMTTTPGVGCNVAIAACIEAGFMHGDGFHIHLEDDTLPAEDFLLFMQWASLRYAGVDRVFTVSGYGRRPGSVDGAVERRWFTPWGWGIWRDRWESAKPLLRVDQSPTWDVQMHQIRGDRFEVAPALGRVQNIGQHGGAHNTPDFWLGKQFNPVWKDSVATEPVISQYSPVGIEDTEE